MPPCLCDRELSLDPPTSFVTLALMNASDILPLLARTRPPVQYLNVTQGDLQRDLDVLEASADFAAVTSFTSPPPQPSTLTCLSLCVAWARVKFRFDPRGVFQALPPRSRGGAASHLRPLLV